MGSRCADLKGRSSVAEAIGDAAALPPNALPMLQTALATRNPGEPTSASGTFGSELLEPQGPSSTAASPDIQSLGLAQCIHHLPIPIEMRLHQFIPCLTHHRRPAPSTAGRYAV